jgi:penicillin-binding protein 2
VHWTPEIPTRGRILDRKGRPLAQMGMVTRVGIVPGKITNEADLLAKLPGLLNMTPEAVKARYASGQADWFMPIKDLPDQIDQGLVDQLNAIQGVTIQKWPARVYPQGPVTAHVVGYISQVTAEELPELAARGYVSGDVIGRSGVERFAESWLAGKRGGTLALLGQDDSVIRVLGQVPSEQAHDVVLTLDLDTQIAADLAIGEQVGSAIVMDPNNGEILALVSKPSYDPNWFILGISDEQWAQLNDPVKQPLVNRATQVGYPTGSVFKLITASAGMVHLGYTEGSVIPCPGQFSLEGSPAVWKDWIPGGQGDLTLHNAIVRSCNTVFYRMGAELDEQDEHWLPDMARAYGFGTPTGIPELDEIAGIVPDPEWKMENVGDFWARGDAVNLAIGQGFFLASTLQLADAYLAVANGGTLWVPHLILDIVRLDGSVAFHADPKEKGKLPVSAEIIGVFHRAMYDVINAGNGTATAAFEGTRYQVSGKTGTAETGKPGEDAHGWFGSFTPSENPRIVVVTMIEHGKAGSTSAAPAARKIIDAYYSANP